MLTRTPPSAAPAPAAGFVDRRASSEALDPDDQPRWGLEAALAVLLVVSLAGFHRIFTGSAWIGPVIGSAVVVQGVCRLTRTRLRSPLVAGGVDLLAVALMTVWTVVGYATKFGVPTRATWHAVDAALTGAGNRFADATVPLTPSRGFLLLAVLGAGFVALAGSWLTLRLGRALTGAGPALAAFVTCACLGTAAGRTAAVIGEVAAVAAVLAVDRSGALARAGWLSSRRGGGRRTAVLAVPLAAAAVVVAAAVAPLAGGPDGHGPLGWRTSADDSTRVVISPLVSLQTRLMPKEAGIKVFTVTSTAPSYWRLTSLDSFDGTEWNAKDTYQGVDGSLPGVTGTPAGTRRVVEHFHIQGLDEVWLPLAFDPVSVKGAGAVSYDPQSGSLLAAGATSNGLAYTVTSLQYLATLSPSTLRRAPALTPGAEATYLQLPASVPARVRDLARTIVAGSSTEYGRALALERYFHGPQFTYSLDPPANGSGTSALESFLFQTRTGYCQQFAGAYAVLARAVGLPTRLAVGFTTGRAVGPDTYQVTDADAHVWPEVWFPRYGWVPFEPTKGSPGAGFTIPDAPYTGNTASPTTPPGGAKAPTPTATTVPTPTTVPAHSSGRPSGASTTLPQHYHGQSVPGSGAKKASAPPLAGGAGHRARTVGDGLLAAVAVGAAVLAFLLLLGSNAVGRRLRWRARHRRLRPGPGGDYGPDALAVVWEEVAEPLAWRGFRRDAAETHRHFARRVAAGLRGTGERDLAGDLLGLAVLVEQASFAGHGVTPAEVDAALGATRRIRAVLDRQCTRRERLHLLVDPRAAWRPATIVPSEPIELRLGI